MLFSDLCFGFHRDDHRVLNGVLLMCFRANVPSAELLKRLLGVAPENYARVTDQQVPFVEIPICIETLLYRKSEFKVLIACDVIIRNTSKTTEQYVLLTHPDNVQGRLATEDWFPQEANSDDRKRLIESVYGPSWSIDHGNRSLRFVDPANMSVAIAAEPLTVSRQELAGRKVHDECVYHEDEWLGTYRLKNCPQEISSVQEFQPYSTFLIGPIPPDTTVFARVTVVISDGAYKRLVLGASADHTFTVVGPDRLFERLHFATFEENRGAHSYDTYRQFFDSEIATARIVPERYQVLIGQPQNNSDDAVLVRPTTSNVSEWFIPDDDARENALWYNARLQDFCLVLAYEGDVEKPQDETKSRRARAESALLISPSLW